MLTDKGGVFHFFQSFDLDINKILRDILENIDFSKDILNFVDENGYTAFLKFIQYYNRAKNYQNRLMKRIQREEIIKINEERKKKKLKLLELEESDLEDDENDLNIPGNNSACNDESGEESNEDQDEEQESGEDEEEVEEEEEEEQGEEEEEEEQEEEEEEEEAGEEEVEEEEEEEEEMDQEGKDEGDEVEIGEINEIAEEDDMEIDNEKSPGKKPKKVSEEFSLQVNKKAVKEIFLAKWHECEEEYLSILNLLIQKGADPHAVVLKLKKYRENPDLAKSEETSTNINFITTFSGEKIYNEYNEDGQKSAYHLISTIDDPKLLNFLLQQKIHINHQDFYGFTPILAFITNKNPSSNLPLLLDNGADPDLPNHEGKTCMHLLSESDLIDSARFLLNQKINLNVLDKKGKSPLIIAADKRFDKMVRLLCEAGADPNFTDKKNRTALHAAFNSAVVSSNASFAIESVLLNHGANINAVDSYQRSPLHYAFIKRHKKNDISHIDPIETVSSACSRKEINVNIQDFLQRTPLHYAARRGALTSTMFLLSKGALIDIQDIEKNTPLGLGIIGGHSNYVSMLIQRNPDIKKNLFHIKPKDLKKSTQSVSEKKSKLKYQEYSYFRACVRLNWQGAAYLLLFAGYPYSLAMQDALNEEKFNLFLTLFAKVDDTSVFHEKNLEDQNLFHTLAIKGRKAQEEVTKNICEQLLDYKVDFNAVDKYGKTPLHYAAEKLYLNLCKFLLEKGSNINAKDNDGHTPLVKAVGGDLILKSLDLLKLFKAHNADFNIKIPSEGYTTTILLHSISKQCSNILINFLLTCGCNILETDSLHRNALMHLIMNNDLQKIKKLINNYKFDLNHQDISGKTIIHYAISPFSFGSYENKELLQLLITSKADASIKDNQGKSPYYFASNQLSGTMKEVLEKNKIKENIIIEKKNSENDYAFMDIDYLKDAEDYENTMQDIKKIKVEEKKPDPAGDFADYYKVIDDYDIYMTKVDISYGPFSAYVFYRMQLLHDTNRDVYVLFTRWGRIGEIGAFQRTPFSNRDEAEKEFLNVFKNKAGGEWGKPLQRAKGKYRIVKFASSKTITKDFITSFSYDHCPPSVLDKSLEEMVKIITNNAIYRESLQSFCLDEDSINFSNLSRESIDEAEEVLLKLKKLVDTLTKSKSPDLY